MPKDTLCPLKRLCLTQPRTTMESFLLARVGGIRPALVPLYADISGYRVSDPPTFRAHIAWWLRTLSDACWQRVAGEHALVFVVNDGTPDAWALADVGRPMCMAVAIDDAARSAQWMRMGEYIARSTPLGARPSITTLLTEWVLRPAWRWALSDELGGDDTYWGSVRGTWVVCANVEVRRPSIIADTASCPPFSRDSRRAIPAGYCVHEHRVQTPSITAYGLWACIAPQ